MPLYTFESEDGLIEDLFYKMEDVPSLGKVIELNGVKWTRVFTKPNAAIATQSDPYSVKDFNKSLDGKNVTFGDMFDAAKEASIKRESKEGIDPVKQKYYADYAKARHGVKHQNEKKEKFEKTQKELGISLKL